MLRDQNNFLKQVIGKIFAVFFVISVCAVTFSGVFEENNSVETSSLSTPQKQVTTKEHLNSVGNNFSFDIVSSYKITNDNKENFIVIKNSSNENIDYILKINNSTYTILPPSELYTSGRSYHVRIYNSNFCDKEFEKAEEMSFSVFKEEISNVSYYDGIKKLSKDELIHLDEENSIIEVSNTDINEQDVFIIPVDKYKDGILIDIAFKVEELIKTNSNSVITYSTPSLEETFSELEINKESYMNGGDVQYVANEEYIKNQIANSDDILALSKAVYTINTGEYVHDDEPLCFSGNINVETNIIKPVDISLKFNNFTPLDVEFSVEWEIKKEKIPLKLILNCHYESNVTAFVYSDKVEKRQSTITSSKQTISLSLETSKDLVEFEDESINSLESRLLKSNKIETINRKGYEAQKELDNEKTKLLDKSLTEKERQVISKRIYELDNTVTESNYATAGYLEHVRKKTAEDLELLSKIYAETYDKSNTTIDFFTMYIPVAPGVAVRINAGMILEFNVNAVLNATLVINNVDEVGTITTEEAQKEFRNSDTIVSLSALISGSVEFKIGGKVDVGFTIAGILNVGVSGEIGLYFEMSGQGAIMFGDEHKLGASDATKEIFDLDDNYMHAVRVIGNFDADVGHFARLNFETEFDFKLVTITFSSQLAEVKNSFFKKEDELVRDLVFDDDYGLTFDQIIEKSKNILEDNQEQAVTKTISLDNGVVNVPTMYVRSINPQTKEVTYEKVLYKNFAYMGLDDINIYGFEAHMNDWSQKELKDEIILMYKDDNGEYIKELFLPLTVIKEPIKVESIHTLISDEIYEIQVDDCKSFRTEIEPFNASYQDLTYVIDEIVIENKSVNDVESYAHFEQNVLKTSKNIPLGAKIYVYAEAVKDKVKSDILCVTVVKTPVEDFRLAPNDYSQDIKIGDSIDLNLTILPFNATVTPESSSDIRVEVISNIGVIENNYNGTYKLTAPDGEENKNEVIVIEVQIEELIKEFCFYIDEVTVSEIALFKDSLFTNSLSETIEIEKGDTLQIYSQILPENATVSRVEYSIFSLTANYDKYISINEDGIIKVAEDTPTGFEFYVSASAKQRNSKTHKIIVQKVPVENVYLYLENGINEVMVGSDISISSKISPSNATNQSVIYEIINKIDGVSIQSSGLIQTTLSKDLIDYTILVKATVDGVQSDNIIEIHIVNIPVESVNLYSEVNSILAGNSFSLSSLINPKNAGEINAVQYKIISGGDIASISHSGLVTVNKDIIKPNPTIQVQATCNGVKSNIVEIKVIVPVISVVVTSNANDNKLQQGNSAKLSSIINPSNASIQDATYKIIKGGEFSIIENDYIIINSDANVGEKIIIVSFVDGVESSPYNIEVTKVPVERVEFLEKEIVVNRGMTTSLITTAYPFNATYKNAVYTIVNGESFGYIDNDILVVNASTQVGSIIEIEATIDGVNCSENLFVTTSNINLDNVIISYDNDIEKALPSSIINFNTQINLGSNENYSVTYGISQESSSYGEITNHGTLIIFDEIYERFASINVYIYVEGIRIEKEIKVSIYVPMTELKIKTDNIIYPNSDFKLEFIFNENATSQHIYTSILEGERYATIENNILKVSNNIKSSNEIIKISYYSEDLKKAQEYTFNIYVKVENIELSSSSNYIMKGYNDIVETMQFNVAIYPSYATNPVYNFSIVEKDKQGVSIDSKTGILTVNKNAIEGQKLNVKVLSEDGEFSMKEIIITKRPVTDLAINSDIPTDVYRSQMFEIVLGINEDACYKGINFTNLNSNISLSIAENIAKIKINSNANFGTVEFIVYAVDNKEIIQIINFEIKPVYASEIRNVNLAVINNSSENDLTLLNGERYAMPNEKILFSISDFVIEEKYGDAEITYTDFTLQIIGSKSTGIGKVEGEYIYIDKEQISDSPYIAVNVIVYQNGGKTLTFEKTFNIYIPVSEISIEENTNAKAVLSETIGGKKATLNRGQTYNYIINYNGNNVASEKGYSLSVVENKGSGNYIKAVKLKDDSIYDLCIQINLNATADMFIEVTVTSQDDLLGEIKDSFVIEIAPLFGNIESNGIEVEYGKDDKNVQLVEIGSVAQLMAGCSVLFNIKVGVMSYTRACLENNGITVKVDQNDFLINESQEELHLSMESKAVANQNYDYKITLTDGGVEYEIERYLKCYKDIDENSFIVIVNGKQAAKNDNGGFNGMFNSSTKTNLEYSFGRDGYEDYSLSVTSSAYQYRIYDNQLEISSTYNVPVSIKLTIKNNQKYNNRIVDDFSCPIDLTDTAIYNNNQLDNIRNNLDDTKASVGDYTLETNLTYYDWSPINEFAGTFNGNNNQLTLTMNKLVDNSIGFIAKNSGTIKNLNIKGSISYDHSGSTWIKAGIFAGTNNGTIAGCNTIRYFSSDISSTLSGNTYDITNADIMILANTHCSIIGGIVGVNIGSLTNIKNYSTIYGRGNIGGIAGESSGNIYNAYNFANILYLIYVQNSSIGGIVGFQEKGTINFGYNFGTIKYICKASESTAIQPNIGSIVGLKQGEVINYYNCGSVDIGTLKTISWKTGALWWEENYSHNQAKYAGNRAFGKVT